MITLEEYFAGRNLYVSHLKKIGALVYCHVSKDLRKKLEPIVELGVFLGYTETPHNYWVYLPSLRMTTVMRDVNFDEENAMRCSLEWELSILPKHELLAPKEEP